MSKRDPSVTLRLLLAHAGRIQELTSNLTLEAILRDWRLTSAFEREMEVLGEAVKRLPPELTARYPAIPWKAIAGTRDHLSHGYDSTDYQILWTAAQRDVPELIRTVEQMVRDLKA
jgi:uncharacterized protein with HEPN domain